MAFGKVDIYVKFAENAVSPLTKPRLSIIMYKDTKSAAFKSVRRRRQGLDFVIILRSFLRLESKSSLIAAFIRGFFMEKFGRSVLWRSLRLKRKFSMKTPFRVR